ncbi:MAG TPA: GatB/YqeY domain-containing protein [Candidatus Xenobia bacterium]|jgi:hypothetical protein
MSDLVNRIQQDLIVAMKAQDTLRLSTLRMVKTALKLQEVERRGALDDATALQVLQRLCKQRLDSIEQFEQGNRKDLADKERAELKFIEAYMPPAVDDAAIQAAIDEVVTELGATGPKQMGAVMGKVMARFKGQTIDGKRVQALVGERLKG